ncbi:hypothetical protein ML462_10385 [Gramella lutea]|uniref:Thioredoxin domain-containing protein n=1 Tax=Christiangramia lutea TaxID=1607951 RepID=A0A9X1V3U9_9FLAO|nr:hypothetical protein [Christiangramia lutea]MCH4823576.1 hypothetical protein [Christiangramia lutea]
MKNIIFIIAAMAFLITGCDDNSGDSESVYIGGQINNPETDFVIISKENKNLDTLYLDENNQFGQDFPSLDSGIYTFTHPPESQIMYAEPGDSLVIWLNTLAFDESLNFSGKGSEKSNFLLDMFLKNRKNNDLIITYYKIEPAEFARITDSIKSNRLDRLEKLKENNEFSEDFLKIARASIDYEFYDLRERYTFLIKKYYNNFSEKIPDNFNDYRKEIDFNDAELQDYYIYTNLIDDYLRSKSIEYCAENHEDHKRCFNLNSYKNIERRILLIDSISDIEQLKNEFLDRLATQAITMAERESRLDSVLNLLESINYSNLNEARQLAEIQKNYFNGKSLNEFTALDTKGNLLKYKNIIDSPTITFGWSIYSPAHHRWQHDIISNLKEKYPEIKFLGVNIDLGEREEWLRTLETFGYSKENEFQIAHRSTSRETYKKYLNKVFFVNADGTIVKGDVNFGSPEFEGEVLEFLNK